VSPFPNIALMGRARSGKDSVAAHLVARFAYGRIAFADPLREAALKIDPWMPVGYAMNTRLSSMVERHGWEYAKDAYPEVRRLLQHIGQTVRDYDEDFWLNVAARKISGAAGWGIPVVVTDVRYPNEYDALRRAGFTMVRVVRPSEAPPAPHGNHVSETALDGHEADVTVYNTSTLDELRARAELLATAK